MSISGKNPVAERLYGPDGLGPAPLLVPPKGSWRGADLATKVYGTNGLGPQVPGCIEGSNLHRDLRRARKMRP